MKHLLIVVYVLNVLFCCVWFKGDIWAQMEGWTCIKLKSKSCFCFCWRQISGIPNMEWLFWSWFNYDLHIWSGFLSSWGSEFREGATEGLSLLCSTQCCSKWHRHTLEAFSLTFKTHTETHKHAPQVIPPALCSVVCEVMLLGKDGKRWEWEGWWCLRGESDPWCLTAVWFTCVVIFVARKLRSSPHEFIIRLFQLRHAQWTQNPKQDLDIWSHLFSFFFALSFSKQFCSRASYCTHTLPFCPVLL